MFLYTASQTPAVLLQQISSLHSEKQDEDMAAQMIRGPAENKNKDLIQVISTTFVQPQEPEYQLEVKADTAGVPRCVELTVELPEVCSMSECQLRISKVSGYTLPWTVIINHFRFQCVSVCSWMFWKKHSVGPVLRYWVQWFVLNVFFSAGWHLAGSGGSLLFASGITKNCKWRHSVRHL